MAVERFTAENFRCLKSIELRADAAYNVIYGENASGKTSLLEALAYLGRGKSFRGAATQSLVRHGEREFVLFGEVTEGRERHRIGVRNSSDGLEIRVDGSGEGGSAALVAALPLQVIDPEVHSLVSGGPEMRRRFLDWIAFHVEPQYLDAWRRFRRTLKQRNAALRSGARQSAIQSWDAEFVAQSIKVDEARRLALEVSIEALKERSHAMLGHDIGFEYAPGWPSEKPLEAVLAEGLERDRKQGATQAGPHRADLKLSYDERQAKRLVSRGQQKLLACSMILAAAETAQTALERPLVLLLDDPAAELDENSLARLMEQVVGLGAQVIATSLDKSALRFPSEPAVFHVEHGELTRVS
ncbi:MAG: DNA replication/repair protein RecF [Woeseiaceae bacterium]|nr:DNA replication/repair protein RecF [Woeseiaceae bacterium]